jgi:hypothetical protein
MGRALLLVLIAAASTAVAQQGQSQSKETVSPEVAAALKKVDAFFKDNDIKLWWAPGFRAWPQDRVVSHAPSLLWQCRPSELLPLFCPVCSAC